MLANGGSHSNFSRRLYLPKTLIYVYGVDVVVVVVVVLLLLLLLPLLENILKTYNITIIR